MPRIYDFVKSSPYRPVRLAEQKVSAEEIHPLQILAEKRRNLQGRHYQFTAILIPDKRLFQQTMSQAYGWLSQRGAGPFHWHEGEKHNGHGLEVKVHFEQLPDIRAFKEMWGPAFQYEKDTDFHLENLAAIKGVLPVRGSVTQWALEHGVKVEFDHVAQGVMVIIKGAEQARLFESNWGETFKRVVEGKVNDGAIRYSTDKLLTQPPILPDDFRDYYLGKCDFSAVRTLLKPNGILPNAELACK